MSVGPERLTPRQKKAQQVFLRATTFFALCCGATVFLITSQPITPRNVFWLCILVVLAVINYHIMRAAYCTWSKDEPFRL